MSSLCFVASASIHPLTPHHPSPANQPGRTVGIGAYLVRLGQRTIQKSTNAPIILTGFQVRTRPHARHT